MSGFLKLLFSIISQLLLQSSGELKIRVTPSLVIMPSGRTVNPPRMTKRFDAEKTKESERIEAIMVG